jgi:hypothetical protein
MGQHPLYPALKATAETLTDHGIRFLLAGGTQLGAVRDGALIGHDYDFDLDVFIDHPPPSDTAGARTSPSRIRLSDPLFRRIAEDLERKGLGLEEKWIRGVRLADGQRMDNPESFASVIRVTQQGQQIGDLYLFTVFSDGIARRYDPVTTTYFNPRTQNPAWYCEQPDTAELYGDPYPVMRDAHVVCENIYGPQWQTPIAPGSHGPGRHKNGGAVVDRDLEPIIIHALRNGWDTDYSQCPQWPPPITHVNSMRARPWVVRNEPLVDITGGDRHHMLYPSPSDVGIAEAMALRNAAVRGLRKASDDTRVLEAERANAEAERANAEAERANARLDASRQRLAEQHEKLRQIRRNPVAFGWRYGLRKIRWRPCGRPASPGRWHGDSGDGGT